MHAFRRWSVVAAVALASCATVPQDSPPPAPPAAAAAPEALFISPRVLDIGPIEPELADDLASMQATGGDPSSVNNATIDLHSEYADLWDRLRQGFELPDLVSPLVKKSEDWYAQRPDYVARMVERSRRYLYYIVSEVNKRHMPLEVALLPMIESAYNPMALSTSRASGIWQFIPSTGKLYGMKQNWWMDERRDVVAATDGALDYLERLYAEFGDWSLALAAYNWGEGSVRRAIAYNLKRGLPTNYLSLTMPAETREYVPKLQAVKNIIRYPQAFNLSLAPIPDAPYFTVVRTRRKMDVKAAADLAEMTEIDFLSLNPQHNRPVIAGADEATILLPYDKAEVFAAKLALSDQPMVTWQAYNLRNGESLAQVAARFGLSLETLRTVNGIGTSARVPVGHALLVPTQAPSSATLASLQHTVFTTVPNGRTIYHRVRKGETLQKIAKRYDVTLQDLQGWNPGLGVTAVRGQNLRVISNRAATPAKAKRRRSGASPAPGVHTKAAGAVSTVGAVPRLHEKAKRR